MAVLRKLKIIKRAKYNVSETKEEIRPKSIIDLLRYIFLDIKLLPKSNR